MTRVFFVVCLTASSAALAAEVCEAPRNRDTAPLATAAAQDKVVATAFEKAAAACAERGPACDQARLECGTLVTSIVQKQAGFDEGVWLRDLLLPYQGQSYVPTRSFGAFQLATDASCNVDVATLNAAALRRTRQAARRDALLQEYQLYVRWSQDQLSRCKARVAAEEQRAAEAKAESERVAAAAAAASAAAAAAAAAKAAQEAEARKRAEAQAAAQQEAQRRAEEQARAQREAQEEAKRQQEERARAQQEAAERQRAEQERAKREAEEKAREQAEAQAVAQREAQKEAARKQKEELLAQADAEEEAARRAAEQKAEALRKKAAGIEVMDDDERARGNISIMAVAGVLNGWAGNSANMASASTSFAMGAGVAAHVGFWGTAPAQGMASGFELRLSGRFVQTVSGPSANALEGLLTGRYYFGHFGFGAAGALRFYDTFQSQSFDAGGSLAVALMDTPRTRVLLAINWVPVGTSMDLTRFAGDFEVSYRYFTFHAHGGMLTTRINGQNTLGWEAGASLGARLGW
jgi:chemotaxis protein histidine kinase CheA